MTILAPDADLIEPTLDLGSDRSEVAKARSGARFRFGLKARLGTATFLAALLVTILGGIIAPSMASAGTNGMQIDIRSSQSHSMQICGTDQNNNYVCDHWNTPGGSLRLSGWFWNGTVSVTLCHGYNMSGCYGRFNVSISPSQQGGWLVVFIN